MNKFEFLVAVVERAFGEVVEVDQAIEVLSEQPTANVTAVRFLVGAKAMNHQFINSMIDEISELPDVLTNEQAGIVVALENRKAELFPN